MQLSRNFTSEEFACKCGCGFDKISPKLISLLQVLRDTLDSSITINSGCRCAKHNASVGGAGDSQHVKGTAADIVVKGFTPRAVYELLTQAYPDTYGVGVYKSWVHIDVRETKARWDES